MTTGPEPAAADLGRKRPVIRVLPDGLVDQIAAGEVVERPASVAKELVENALDAGARRVRIEVRGGGTELLAVTDDGCGMTPDEARLALQRHATSKLATASDLSRITTYGFRGEALPAIASVSRLRLRTRVRGAAQGFELEVEAGEIVEARPAGGPEGTRIEVADLFVRVPARRKFLKSPQTEWGHVADWAARVALARPDLHLELVRDDRPALVWPATDDVLARVAAVLSEEDAAAMVVARRREGAASLHALVSRPDRHRPNAESLHLFVNGRPVRDRLLRHAVLEPYRDVLPRGRFPAAVLFLDLPPDAVDVNVHPAKWEVRFADPRAIHHLVSETVKQALGQRSWLAGTGPGGAAGPAWRSLGLPEQVAEGAPSDWILAQRPAALLPQTQAASTYGPDPAGAAALPEAAPEGRLRFAALRLLGQLQCTYLIVESPQALLLVDQHAAHERVLYERLRAAWREGGVSQQALLLPATLDLSPAAHAALVARVDTVTALGFDVEAFGDVTVVIRAIPSLLAGHDPGALVRSLADELLSAQRGDGDATPGVRSLPPADRLFATLACHSARRKGEALEPLEQRALLEALDEIPWAPCCPHGRPVAVPIDLFEIERRFGRR
jgi:DNA mismatch repair protein MutL